MAQKDGLLMDFHIGKMDQLIHMKAEQKNGI